MLRKAAAAIVLIALGVAAPAEPLAFVALGAGEAAGEATAMQASLQVRGFRVSVARGASAEALRRGLAALPADPAERVAIVLTGRFVHSARGAWLLAPEAGAAPTLRTVEAGGLSLVTLAEIAAEAKDGAVLVLGEAEGPAPGQGLSPGIGPADWLPEDVALIRGPAALIPAFVRDGLLRPGFPLAAIVAARPGLALGGAGDTVLVPPAAGGASAAEDAAWDIARATGTEAAYEAFLQRWPSGRRAAEAQAALAALRVDPAAAEAALNLTREARRAAQQALVELGHDTRGIDGIFGPGTRAAIAAWQRSSALPATGFLTAPQLERLAAEAARAVAAREAADRAFWAETGARGDAAGLRAYLGRYPQGLFAATARERLAPIEAAEAAARDRAAWDRARTADTAAAYRRYLEEFPRGIHAADARARLEALDAAERDRAAWARAVAEGTQGGFLAYLEAFPRGLHAADARARVEALTGSRQDRAAWDRARAADRVPAYRGYLADFPRGAFVREAEARIAALGGGEDEDALWARVRREDTAEAYRAYLTRFPEGRHADQARRRLAALEPPPYEASLGPIERLLTEQMLAALGHDPGRVDGVFDEATRAAIRRYQAATGRPVTGFLDGPVLPGRGH